MYLFNRRMNYEISCIFDVSFVIYCGKIERFYFNVCDFFCVSSFKKIYFVFFSVIIERFI